MQLTHSLRALVLGAALGLVPAGAALADFPERPVTLIVGASAGGTTDSLARILAQGLGETFDQPFVVDNRPGAGGNLAAQAVTGAPADGHTLLVAFTSHTLNASLFETLPHDPIADFAPIALLAQGSSILLSRADLPFDDLEAMLEHGRTAADGVTFAVGGLGSSLHMETLKFINETGVDGDVIPYPGTAPAVTDLMGGHVDFMFAPFAQALPLIESGQVNAIAVTTPERFSGLPDLQTVSETLPDYPITYSWFGVLGRAGTDLEIVATLNGAILEVMQGEAAQRLLGNEGAQGNSFSPEEFAEFLVNDLEGWQAIAEAANIERQ
ncbi:MAG: Bug family tripartite tricarboxylate transporter substrate binding protein [Alkalilacustris sp.]